jgi:hypothetical protein
LQGFLLQVEIPKIIVHEAGKPNAFADFFDAELLSGEHCRDIDSLTMQAEAAAGRDED